jgi:hypothetical protein
VVPVSTFDLAVPRVHPLADHEGFVGTRNAVNVGGAFQQLFADVGALRCGCLLRCGGGVEAGRVHIHLSGVDMHRPPSYIVRAIALPGLRRADEKKLMQTKTGYNGPQRMMRAVSLD